MDHVPGPIEEAIRAATQDSESFRRACELFVRDTTDASSVDGLRPARLEQALARTALDTWKHGLGSAESVGAAYASLAKLLHAGR